MTTSTSTRGGPSFLGSFSNPNLGKLYAAEIVSGAGDGIFWVSLVVFLTGQPRFGLWLTLAVVARLAPRALLSLPAGSLVDRWDLHRLLVVPEAVRGAMMLLIAVVVGTGAGPIPVLLLVAASFSIGAPTRPALSAIVPTLAGERHLAVANAALSTIRQMMTFIGPLLGAAVVTWSVTGGFAINGVAFATSAMFMAWVKGIPKKQPRTSDEGEEPTDRDRFGLIHSFKDSTRAVRAINAMPALIGLLAVMYMVRGAELVLHVYVVRDQLNADIATIGLFGGAIGLGALVAMPLASKAANSDSPVRAIHVSMILTALPTAALAFIERTPWAFAVLVLVGMAMVVFEVVIVVTVQRITEEDSLGRVFGAINSAGNAGKLLGAIAAPGLVVVLGLTGALLFIGSAVLVLGALGTLPLLSVSRAADQRRHLLAPRVELLSKLGIFEGATTVALERIASSLEEERALPGAVLITEGDQPDSLYVILRGEFEVTVEDRYLNTLGAGDWFGEIGLIDHRPRTATVTSGTEVEFWSIPGQVFLAALEESGAPPSALVEAMADRLAAHN